MTKTAFEQQREINLEPRIRLAGLSERELIKIKHKDGRREREVNLK